VGGVWGVMTAEQGGMGEISIDSMSVSEMREVRVLYSG
jgi:hypothetical protein